MSKEKKIGKIVIYGVFASQILIYPTKNAISFVYVLTFYCVFALNALVCVNFFLFLLFLFRGMTLTAHRKVAVSFRDRQLHQIFSLTVLVLRQVVTGEIKLTEGKKIKTTNFKPEIG